jgi:hypothetical protein
LCTAQTSLSNWKRRKTSAGKIYCHHKMSLEANCKKEIFLLLYLRTLLISPFVEVEKSAMRHANYFCISCERAAV